MSPATAPAQAYDAVVLGAGITGLTVAYGLQAQGYSVCLVDDYAVAGGNHISDEIEGMTFDIGAIFHWSHSDLFKMFPSLLEQCVPVKWRTDRINPQGAVVSYPFETKTELWSGSPAHAFKVLSSMAMHRLMPQKTESAHNFLTHYLGRELLTSSGLERYVERLYGKPAQEISYEFAKARMLPIISSVGLKHNAQRLAGKLMPKQKSAPSQCLARPASGFAGFYADAIRELEAKGVVVQLGAGLREITRDGETHKVETASTQIETKRLVSTIPLTRVSDLAGIDASEAPTSLPLYSLYWKFRGDVGFEGPILYNFQDVGRWKRLTLHSQYYGEVGGWSYFSTETTVHKDEDASVDLCEADFRDSIANAPILNGDLELVGHRCTDFAYPLYDHAAAERRMALMDTLKANGIECVGRQGAFEYLPITQMAIRRARALLETSQT